MQIMETVRKRGTTPPLPRGLKENIFQKSWRKKAIIGKGGTPPPLATVWCQNGYFCLPIIPFLGKFSMEFCPTVTENFCDPYFRPLSLETPRKN